METTKNNTVKPDKITVEVIVKAPVDRVWKMYSTPADIMKWNSASGDWHTPHAENDLRAGGKFSSRMEAKDGSMGFDFSGVYDKIVTNELIEYTMGDGRKASVVFTGANGETKVSVSFDPETENSPEMQKGGWQAILDNFKKYAESN